MASPAFFAASLTCSTVMEPEAEPTCPSALAVPLTMLPSTLLSGLIFPISSMPLPLQLLSSVVPARWFIVIVRGVMLKGAGLEVLWAPLAVLTLMLLVLLGVSIRRTSVRLA